MPKKKYNGFYYFMKEMQENESSRGNNISMANLPAVAHPLWKEMSVAQKEPYEKMAKQNKNTTGQKLASDGTKVDDNQRELEEIDKKRWKMIQDVKSFVNVDCVTPKMYIGFKANTPKKTIYILSFNILCRTEDDVYIPNEVGLVEYSIQHGIQRQYHKFINPGSIPNGYTGEAKRHSENTHNIPYYGQEGAEKNPKVIFDEIKEFTNPKKNDEFPPVFCSSKAVELTTGCLEWLAVQSRCHYDRHLLKVLNATFLLMELMNGVGKAFPSETIAEDRLSANSFDFHPSSRCDFHEELDIPHCALGYSKRICYLLSDSVCQEGFGITLTENHIPTRALETKDYEIVQTSTKQHSSYPASAGRGYGRGNSLPPTVQPGSRRFGDSMDSLDSFSVRAVRVPVHDINNIPSNPIPRQNDFANAASSARVQNNYYNDFPSLQGGIDDFEEFPSLPTAAATPYSTDREPRQPTSLAQDLKKMGLSNTTVEGRGGIGRGWIRN